MKRPSQVSLFFATAIFAASGGTNQVSIHVTGAVKKPGSITNRVSLAEAIAKSGGFASRALPEKVRLIRWKPGTNLVRQVILVDMSGGTATNELIHGDVILVPLGGPPSESSLTE